MGLITNTLSMANAVGREESKIRALTINVLGRLESAGLVTCEAPHGVNRVWTHKAPVKGSYWMAREIDRRDGRGRAAKAIEVNELVLMSIIALTHREDHRASLAALTVG